MDVLAIDIGGTQVKLRTSSAEEARRFQSGPHLTPDDLVEKVRHAVADWNFDVIAIGLPGAVENNAPAAEPGNLGPGWVGFDFARALGRPVRVVNDAVMQALGGYQSGRMLFLGLGTGVGSALVTEHVVVPLELGSLPHTAGGTIAERLGRAGLARDGRDAWQQAVEHITPVLRDAFVADYVLLGGGNAQELDRLPPHTRRGDNHDAFIGGFRLWEETIEPHDRRPPPVWRVVR
jgi:polyphosphate glucokinase